jgi:tetratricopeptide (TPR) repeat protein
VALFDRLRRLLPGAMPSGLFARGTPAPFARGTRALERGQLDVAEAAFEEALSGASGADEVSAVRNKRAILAIMRGDRAGAIGELIEALDAQPRSPAAITTVGNLLLEDGALADAIEHYEYALLIDDEYGPAYHNLGVALHRSGRRGEAVRMLRKATRLEGRIKRTWPTTISSGSRPSS